MSDSGVYPALGRGSRGSRLRPTAGPVVPPTATAATFAYLGVDYRGEIEARGTGDLTLRLAPFDGELLLYADQSLGLRFETPGAEPVECDARVLGVRHEPDGYRVKVEPRRADATRLDIDRVKIDPTVALRVPPGLAFRRGVLPFGRAGGAVHVACADPADAAGIQALERIFQVPVTAHAAEVESLRRALTRVYGQPGEAGPGTVRVGSMDLSSIADAEPDGAVALGEELFHAAVLREASDIHIDPGRDRSLVRFRVDGVLEPYRHLTSAAHPALVSRLKVMCGMNIAERRAPQDGGFTYTFAPTGRAIDVRAAALPTKYGERLTLRLLAVQTEPLTLDRLGMTPDDQARFEQVIDQPHGLVLLTGPTGSGKSTTLAAGLRYVMGRENLNVLTVEDPIEYDLPGAAQVEVDAADKVSFGKALRNLLRHDPDVIMIGEIRDTETARIAIQASLTGHLVFSTLHTNTAAGVVTRLADMGVERYLVGASLRLAVAQRLVRRLCANCAKPRPLTAAEAAALHDAAVAGVGVWEPGGCVYCGGRGYHGRVGLFELLPVDGETGRLIAAGADEGTLSARAADRHVVTLAADAVRKLRCGLTSVREVMAAVRGW